MASVPTDCNPSHNLLLAHLLTRLRCPHSSLPPSLPPSLLSFLCFVGLGGIAFHGYFHPFVLDASPQTRLDNESLRMRKIEMKQEEREDDLRLMKLYTEIEEARIKRRDDEMAERARQQAARQRGYEKNEGAEQAARDKAETDRLMAQQAEKDRIALERIRRDKRNAIERQRDVNKVLLEQIRYKKAKAEEERLSQTEFTAKCRKDAAEYMRDLEQARTADREKKLQQRELLEAQVSSRNYVAKSFLPACLSAFLAALPFSNFRRVCQPNRSASCNLPFPTCFLVPYGAFGSAGSGAQLADS